MATSKINLAANEVLFREGEAGQFAYLIERGRIAILRDNAGEYQLLSELGPGECLGEMALISHDPRMASAMALEDTTLTVITRDHLKERMARSDPLIRHLLQLTLKRYRQSLGQTFLDTSSTQDLDYLEDEQQAMQRMRTEHDLRHALENEEFILHYQPIVRLADRVTTGFEALLRWRRDDGQLVSPDLFISVAEESQIIERIGHWIINEASRARAQLHASYQERLSDDFYVSINLAARQFPDPDLPAVVQAAISRHQLQARQLQMEVTESQILENRDQAIRVLQHLQSMGCRIALDDFGTGYSSLAYLNRLPVDALKIDKMFLDDMLNDAASRTIIAGMARLARDLKLGFIAEGAETEQQVDALGTLGVEHVQGFFFGRPFALETKKEPA